MVSARTFTSFRTEYARVSDLFISFVRSTCYIKVSNCRANQIQGPQNFTLRYREYLIDTIRSRYRLNPYYYTRFYESHLLPEPLIRPLFYDFHGSEGNMEAVRSILTQFMIGPALMAIPILSEGSTLINSYLLEDLTIFVH